jgi:(p)ppGpp synthase/HD superfamily hydrolase
MTPRYEAALAFATAKHAGQTRIGGDPYITHPLAVAAILREWGYADEDAQITALFHDLLEDTDATEEELARLGSAAVLEAVRLLTKPRPYEMTSYLAGIRACPLARAVKAADRLHNLRCAQVADEAFRRKYVLETRQHFLDLLPPDAAGWSEIHRALHALEDTLDLL